MKEYLVKGYSINEHKLSVPDYEQIVVLLEQYQKLDGKLHISSDSMLGFLVAYNRGLKILDDYDHHSIEVPSGNQDIIHVTYDECMDVIHHSMFQDKNDNFAIERDDSFKSSIGTIYQCFGGVDLYPTLEDKAANLLYFITKNHSFIDGNKRIQLLYSCFS